MKSDVISLNNVTNISAILNEAEAAASYRKLDARSALRLRLLAEELVSMLPHLLNICYGSFWIENDGNAFEMHVEIYAADGMTMDKKRIMELSTSGKNNAFTGIMGKIRYVVEMMITSSCCDPGLINAPYFYSSGLTSYSTGDYYCEWSLKNYQAAADTDMDKTSEEWDELEKSIIANLADDVVVGVFDNKVNIVIKKAF